MRRHLADWLLRLWFWVDPAPPPELGGEYEIAELRRYVRDVLGMP